MIVAGLWLALPAVAQAASFIPEEATTVRNGYTTQYPVPGGPLNLAVETPGRIWFTAPDADGIGVLVVTSEADEPVIRYRVDFIGLARNSEPYDLVYTGDAIWFTLRGAGQIGRVNPATLEVELFTIPTPNSGPTGIAVGADGHVWFAEATGRLGKLDPGDGSIREHPFPAGLYRRPRVEQLAIENVRSIWFTLPDDNAVGNYDPVADEFFRVPTGFAGPTGLTIDAQGRPWITANGGSKVGRYAPGTLSHWAWYDTPAPDSGPAGIVTFDADGVREVWFAQSNLASAGRFQVANSFSLARREAALLAPDGSRPWGIAVDSERHIWIADTERNVIYQLTPPYLFRLYLASVFRQNASD